MTGYQIVCESLDYTYNLPLNRWWVDIMLLPLPAIDSDIPLPYRLGIIDNVEIYLVDGDYVAKTYSMQFVLSGHDKVHRYIPRKQIWIDINYKEISRPRIIYHELIERYMMDNYSLNHDEANEIANRLEKVTIL